MASISIIIPAYNAAKQISKCLDSIIFQTNRPDIEVIVVDDGSTDSTLSILNRYAKQYKYITVYQQKNQKQSAARNNGLKRANGKYIMFFDSDDFLEDNMLSSMYQAIEKGKNDLCICGIKKIFNNRIELETKSCLKNSSDYLADYLTHHKEMDVGLWNKIFKKDIIDEYNLILENGNFFEDTLFVFKYLCHVRSEIVFIEKPLYNLMKRENTTTTKYTPEIEYFSCLLVRKISSYLNKMHLKNYQDYLNTLFTRNIIHVIHHNMKFNQVDKEKNISRLVSEINLKSFKYLPRNYKIALLALKINWSLYEKFYSRKKGI
ncbi:glycosyltransferase family 2 protein [Sporolactobacillus terrae]|uniref:Glycosyltransferase 2-like domain-containing protein n=1 Tax=Sporolactobacillus terrae TaxID=269673 RepID=A0ABX5Q4I0_9BACL|nr:glycosyltransferase family 2 protein [Sporolactobacillus terrae]QAA21556.1 hypothetical protein C0674_02345 [Sporolactobacillus terrae]QAA24528.1 hypothetical protein C0679_02325 [Sporolactobacillus terrae]